MSLQIPKGTRDFLPQDKILRDKIISVLKKNFELFGYNPLETPALEYFETLSSKYAGGEEILKETYTLEDNGGRKLGLRYDLTVPFARVIGMNNQLKLPFKRYQIDKVWRDGPIKLGRYREFYQCDCDVVGTKSMLADAELIALASKSFKELGLDVTIDYNNRKLLNSILEYCGIEKNKQDGAILTLDKLEKIGFNGVEEELRSKNIPSECIEKIKDIYSISSTDKSLLDTLEPMLKEKEGIEEIRQLMDYLESFEVTNANLSISLARGLSYYTGTVYEVFLNSENFTSSLSAGGRFDTMIGLLAGKKDGVPAVGISFGLDVITDAMKTLKKKSSKQSVVDIYIIPIETQKECISLMTKLRSSDLNCEMDLKGRSISKNLNFANQYAINFTIIVGEDEINSGVYTLRDMVSGKESKLKLDELIKLLKEKLQ